MSVENEYRSVTDKIISAILIGLVVLICLIEFCVPVCDVVYSDSVEEAYKKIDEKYMFSDISLIKMQAVTNGTTYTILQSTGENKGDVVLVNWIDPIDLKVNDSFYFPTDVQIAIVSNKQILPLKFNFKDIEASLLLPKKTILITESKSFYDKSHGGKFYIRDLSFIGHIRFYLGRVCHILRCTL